MLYSGVPCTLQCTVAASMKVGIKVTRPLQHEISPIINFQVDDILPGQYAGQAVTLNQGLYCVCTRRTWRSSNFTASKSGCLLSSRLKTRDLNVNVEFTLT
ncbi:hypothetical protein NXS19_005227 [Fusarium pseudograminearum]|nr:hypothetical protein NXS19_005227 [Fusarium pseudograminearum]